MFKEDELYPLYVAFIERKKMSRGAFKLAKMSESAFLDYKKRYLESPGFKYNQDNLYINIVRDIKIDTLLDSTEIDDDFFNF